MKIKQVFCCPACHSQVIQEIDKDIIDNGELTLLCELCCEKFKEYFMNEFVMKNETWIKKERKN